MTTMKAIVQDTYGSAEVLELREIDRPTAGDGEVLVRVHAAGISRGDVHLMTGEPYLMRLLGFGVRRPKNPIPGQDVAGDVVAIGPNVTRFRVGDEVFGIARGSFAEYAVAREDKLAHKPEGLSFEHAAAMPISARSSSPSELEGSSPAWDPHDACGGGVDVGYGAKARRTWSAIVWWS